MRSFYVRALPARADLTRASTGPGAVHVGLYVAGLNGGAIPSSNCIVAVTDVFDALAADRPYKGMFRRAGPRPPAESVGAHFDPQVMAACPSRWGEVAVLLGLGRAGRRLPEAPSEGSLFITG